MHIYVKDPSARVDYQIDWGAAYLGDHVITASTWSVSPDQPGGLTVLMSSHDGRRCAVTLTGGVAGKIYDVTNHVTLSNDMFDDRSITIRVEER